MFQECAVKRKVYRIYSAIVSCGRLLREQQGLILRMQILDMFPFLTLFFSPISLVENVNKVIQGSGSQKVEMKPNAQQSFNNHMIPLFKSDDFFRVNLTH